MSCSKKKLYLECKKVLLCLNFLRFLTSHRWSRVGERTTDGRRHQSSPRLCDYGASELEDSGRTTPAPSGSSTGTRSARLLGATWATALPKDGAQRTRQKPLPGRGSGAGGRHSFRCTFWCWIRCPCWLKARPHSPHS